MLASWGVETDPGQFVSSIGTRGFVTGGNFVFASANIFGTRFKEVIHSWTTPAPVSRIKSLLAAGYGVIACVDYHPGGRVQTHWVQLLELTETGGQIMDPWQQPGHEFVGLEKYLCNGWTPERGIFAVVVYQKPGRWLTSPEESQRLMSYWVPDPGGDCEGKAFSPSTSVVSTPPNGFPADHPFASAYSEASYVLRVTGHALDCRYFESGQIQHCTCEMQDRLSELITALAYHSQRWGRS